VNRALVQISEDSKTKARVYTLITNTDVAARIVRSVPNKTPWLCHECCAFSHGISLYALIEPQCKAHKHVIGAKA
jgi:hypothetical protein